MPNSTCSIDSCGQPVVGRGWCSKHWQRWRKHGDPEAARVIRSDIPTDYPDGTRTCNFCSKRQPITQFDKDASATLGRRAECKACRKAKMKQWYADNQQRQLARAQARFKRDIDKIRLNDLARYERNKDKRIALVIEHSHKRRALKEGATAVKGITVAALRKIHGDSCCYCGVTMQFIRATRGTFIPDKATVEHTIALKRGGTHDWPNVTLCCWKCNVRKNAKPLAEWLAQQ